MLGHAYHMSGILLGVFELLAAGTPSSYHLGMRSMRPKMTNLQKRKNKKNHSSASTGPGENTGEFQLQASPLGPH